MSTAQEKMQAIQHAVNDAKKRKETLDTIKSVSKLNRAQAFELDMTNDCIRRGEALLEDYRDGSLSDSGET